MKLRIVNNTKPKLKVGLEKYPKFSRSMQKHESITIGVMEVGDGIYLIWADFLNRYEIDSYVSDSGNEIICFGNEDEALFGIKIKKFSGIIVSDLSKKTFHATIYTDEAYHRLLKQIGIY